ncbi:alpha/beta fold hydrolase [Streptomyces sp. NPDC003781]|uniref:alpha/beta fold hydrolase n=1 Tax=Streptomyces sp. NPDC003781 TaxID=3364686 RepID=UPI0036C17BF7
MSDPGLAERLGALDLPVHVLWGEHDRIVDPAYGEDYAAAIPGSRFTLLPRTGHLPQVEPPPRPCSKRSSPPPGAERRAVTRRPGDSG